jgi:hypothetical protein
VGRVVLGKDEVGDVGQDYHYQVDPDCHYQVPSQLLSV